MPALYTFLMIWTVIGAITALVAKRKDRNPIAWFFIGFAFSCFGLLFLLLLPPKSPPKNDETSPVTCLESHGEAAAFPPEETPLSPTEKSIRISMNPSMYWYYITPDLKTEGPFKLKELRCEIINKKLNDETYIWCEELPDWTPISLFQNHSIIFDPDFMEDNPDTPKRPNV